MSDSPDVLPHGPLVELVQGMVWMVEGRLSFGLRRAMVLAKLPSGGVWIHSVIRLREEAMAEVESVVGKPTVIVVPNRFHKLDAAFYVKRYRELAIFTTPCALNAVKGIRGLEHAKSFTPDDIPMAFENAVGVEEMSGMAPTAEYVYWLADKTVMVVCDQLFNLNQNSDRSVIGWLLGSLGPLKVTRLGYWLLVKNSKLVADWLTRIAALQQVKLICVAHGDVVKGAGECSVALKGAAKLLNWW